MVYRRAKDVQYLAARALGMGARRVGWTRVEWDCHGNCSNPYLTEHVGRVERALGERSALVDRASGLNRPMTVAITTRCRRCKECKRVKSNLWRHRAGVEITTHPRTWFGTITLRPAEGYRFKLRSARAFGVGYDELDDERKFSLLDAEVFREVTKMVKRIRAAHGGRIRFMCVTERHKSGEPHFHMLVHQVGETPPLTHKQLEGHWPYGFTKWKLAKIEAAAYCAKYVSKAQGARVRASLGYGEQSDGEALEKWEPRKGGNMTTKKGRTLLNEV